MQKFDVTIPVYADEYEVFRRRAALEVRPREPGPDDVAREIELYLEYHLFQDGLLFPF